jgi:hypothetical protein
LLGCCCCSPKVVNIGEDVITIEDVVQVDVDVPDGK